MTINAYCKLYSIVCLTMAWYQAWIYGGLPGVYRILLTTRIVQYSILRVIWPNASHLSLNLNYKIKLSQKISILIVHTQSMLIFKR